MVKLLPFLNELQNIGFITNVLISPTDTDGIYLNIRSNITDGGQSADSIIVPCDADLQICSDYVIWCDSTILKDDKSFPSETNALLDLIDKHFLNV